MLKNGWKIHFAERDLGLSGIAWIHHFARIRFPADIGENLGMEWIYAKICAKPAPF